MIKRFGKFPYMMSLLVRYSALVILGFALFFLWDLARLQDLESWGRFYAIWLPLMYVMFSTAYLLLREWASTDKEKRLFYRLIVRFSRYDEYTFLFPLALLGMILAGPVWKNASLWLSVGYLALVVIKTGLFLTCLFLYLRRASTQSRELKRMSRSLKLILFFAAFVPYLLISAYHQHCISTTGDEPHYLLISHSLLHDHDTNLHNNYENRDFHPFFKGELQPTWGDRVSATEVRSYRHKGGFPAMLLPGYALGGRFGATLQTNLITALLMLQLFLLSYEVFRALTASFATWFCMAFSIPLIVYMGQIYPEPLAALCAVWCVRQMRLLGKSDLSPLAFWSRSLLIGLVCVLIVLLKTRYVPLTATLLLFWGWEIFQNRLQAKQKFRAIFGVFVIFILGGGLALLADKLLLDGMLWDRVTDRNYMSWLLQGYNPLHGIFGLLFDQEYGLLFSSPLYMLSLIGIGLLSGGEWRTLGHFVALFGLNYLFVAFWPLWHAAPTPPSRYILPVLPFLGMFMTKFFGVRGFWVKRIALGICGICSFLLAWSLTLAPWWRYNWADGTNNFFEMQSLRLTMNLNRLFPSFSRVSSLTLFMTVFAVLCMLIVVLACRFEARRERTAFPKELMAEYSVIMILVLFVSLFSGFLVLGKVLKSSVIEAEDKLDVEYRGGERVPKSLDPWDNQIYLRDWKYSGWKLMPEDSITLRPKLLNPLSVFSWREQKNAWGVELYARALLDKQNPGVFPILQIMLDGTELERVVVDSAAWKVYRVTIFSEKSWKSRPALTVVHKSSRETNSLGVVVDKLKFL